MKSKVKLAPEEYVEYELLGGREKITKEITDGKILHVSKWL